MYTKEQIEKLACNDCGSWPCICSALGIGKAREALQRDHRKARPVSIDSNVNATYAAGLRTGERNITLGTAVVRIVKPARKRKGKWC
jgi:primosomal protein N'